MARQAIMNFTKTTHAKYFLSCWESGVHLGVSGDYLEGATLFLIVKQIYRNIVLGYSHMITLPLSPVCRSATDQAVLLPVTSHKSDDRSGCTPWRNISLL